MFPADLADHRRFLDSYQYESVCSTRKDFCLFTFIFYLSQGGISGNDFLKSLRRESSYEPL
jgi:hypothetical protein